LPGLKLTAVLLTLAISLGGCSSSYSVSVDGSQNADYSYRDMNDVLGGRSVDIELNDGGEISAEEVVMSSDSVSWWDAGRSGTSRVATRRIKEISYKNHIIGGLEGCIAAPVVFVGSWSLSGFSREGIGGSDGWALPAALGLIGGGIGLITGGIIGHTYRYEFPTTEQSDSLQNGE
jgi:hypothetical protein